MHEAKLDTIQQIADAAARFQTLSTGHAPESVSVILGVETLVITLHGALSPAERHLSQSSPGALQVQEFHRLLFAASSGPFRREIERITGLKVETATAEPDSVFGAVAVAFASGTMVQVFHFASPAIVLNNN